MGTQLCGLQESEVAAEVLTSSVELRRRSSSSHKA